MVFCHPADLHHTQNLTLFITFHPETSPVDELLAVTSNTNALIIREKKICSWLWMWSLQPVAPQLHPEGVNLIRLSLVSRLRWWILQLFSPEIIHIISHSMNLIWSAAATVFTLLHFQKSITNQSIRYSSTILHTFTNETGSKVIDSAFILLCLHFPSFNESSKQ